MSNRAPFQQAATAARVAGWTNLILPAVVWGCLALAYLSANKNDRNQFKIDAEGIVLTCVLVVPGILFLACSNGIRSGAPTPMQVARVVALVQLLGYGLNLVSMLDSDRPARNGEWLLTLLILVLVGMSASVVITSWRAFRASRRTSFSVQPDSNQVLPPS